MVGLTGVAADGEARVRAQAFACAHVQRAVLYDSLQLNSGVMPKQSTELRSRP